MAQDIDSSRRKKTYTGPGHSQRSIVQIVLQRFKSIWFGLVSAGVIVDAITNSLSIISPAITKVLTIAIISTLVAIEIMLQCWPQSWLFPQGRQKIKGLGVETWLFGFGCIAILWIPRVYHYFVGTTAELLLQRLVTIWIAACVLLTFVFLKRRVFISTAKRYIFTFLIASCILGIIITIQHDSSHKMSQRVHIVLADFQSGENRDYGITQAVFNSLSDLGRQYPDLEFSLLNMPIDFHGGVNEAQSKGISPSADVLIWGSVYRSPAMARLEVHVEILNSQFSKSFSNRSMRLTSDTEVELFDRFVVHDSLAASLKSLTLVVRTLSRYILGDYESTIRRADEALNEMVKSTDYTWRSDLLGMKGSALNQLHRYGEAILALDEAIAQHPSARAFNNRGLSHRRLGMLDNAISDYTHAVALDSNYALAFHNRCYAQKSAGRARLALQDCQKAVALGPMDARFIVGLAEAYRLNGNYNLAADAYTRAAEVNPAHSHYYLIMRAGLRVRMGDMRRAFEDYNKCLRLAPTSARVRHNRAWAYASVGRLDEALKDLNAAIALDPAYALAYAFRCQVRLEMGDSTSARKDCEQARQLDPLVRQPKGGKVLLETEESGDKIP